MKTIILKAFNYLLASVLFLLGFCQVCIAQYGVPLTLFKLRGTVKSEKDNKEIKGIQVIVNKKDTLYSNEYGKFQFQKRTRTFQDTMSINIKFNDTDGKENEEFESIEKTFILTNETEEVIYLKKKEE